MIVNKIFCEGDSDSVLVQYLLDRIYGYSYDKEKKCLVHSSQADNSVYIENLNGITNLKNKIDDNVLFIKNAEVTKSKFIVIIDNDSQEELQQRIQEISDVFDKYDCVYSDLSVSQWNDIKIDNVFYGDIVIQLYIIVLPPEREGALELFLLDNLKGTDSTGDEEKIIEKCENFIDCISQCEAAKRKKYLQNRRNVVKAKFNTYFSVATPNEAFKQRQDILKKVEWERFDLMQTTFACFGELLK